MLGTLRSQDFTPLIGKTGTLVIDDGSAISVLLEEVTEEPRASPRRRSPGRRIPFSVLLSAPLAVPPFVYGNCVLHFDGLDAIEGVHVVRIVPQDETGVHAWYQIVFG